MSRSVPEWIGKTDDSAVPQRVQLRIFERQDGKCALTGHKFRPGDKRELDHKIALVNGGENRESNLQWVLASAHAQKTRQDVAQKSKDRRVRAKHLGIHKPKSTLPGSKGSRFKRKIDGTVVERDD